MRDGEAVGRSSTLADPYDVVIVGGGAAGLSAALVLARARRRVAVVDAGHPRNARASHMHGFLSRDGMPPSELLAAGRAEVQGYGGEIVMGDVHTIDPGFLIHLRDRPDVLHARRVLLATGAIDELPDIAGVHERFGRDVLHCPYCHGWEVRDQTLGVLGTNPGSIQHALLVRQWSSDVVFFIHALKLDADDETRLRARGIAVVEGTVAELAVEEDRLVGVGLWDGRLIPRAAVFICTVNAAHSGGIATGLGCDVDGAGFVRVDPVGRTSVAGVWAAGNLVDARHQVISAAGAGSTAAIGLNADLVEDDSRGSVAVSPG